MGLFDKVKALKNSITGGAAKVYVDSGNISLTEPFDVTVRVQVQDADVKMNRAYLNIEGREEVEVPDTDVVYESDGGIERRREIVRAQGITVDLVLTVAEGQTLEANQNYQWTVSVELPRTAQAPYIGRYCRHRYLAKAGLDCFGNDPDSGWVELEVT